MTEFPDWAQPGMKVAIVTRSGVRTGTVTRHTKTQIVVETPNTSGPGTTSDNFSRGKYNPDWHMVGASAYYTKPRLADPSDPLVQGMILQAKFRRAAIQITARADKFASRGAKADGNDAKALIKDLRDFIKVRGALLADLQKLEEENR